MKLYHRVGHNRHYPANQLAGYDTGIAVGSVLVPLRVCFSTTRRLEWSEIYPLGGRVVLKPTY